MQNRWPSGPEAPTRPRSRSWAEPGRTRAPPTARFPPALVLGLHQPASHFPRRKCVQAPGARRTRRAHKARGGAASGPEHLPQEPQAPAGMGAGPADPWCPPQT